MNPHEELYSLISLFQDQRQVTSNLWVLYGVTTFTAAAFSFKNGAKFPLSLFVALGFIAFTIGHGWLVYQSIESSQAIAGAISDYADTLAATATASSDIYSPAEAAKRIATTANYPEHSMIAHGIIDFCVVVLIVAGRNLDRAISQN